MSVSKHLDIRNIANPGIRLTEQPRRTDAILAESVANQESVEPKTPVLSARNINFVSETSPPLTPTDKVSNINTQSKDLPTLSAANPMSSLFVTDSPRTSPKSPVSYPDPTTPPIPLSPSHRPTPVSDENPMTPVSAANPMSMFTTADPILSPAHSRRSLLVDTPDPIKRGELQASVKKRDMPALSGSVIGFACPSDYHSMGISPASTKNLVPAALPDQPFTSIRNSQSSAIRPANASFHELTTPAALPDQPFTTIRNSLSSAIRPTNASFHELTPPARPDQPFTTARNSQFSAIRPTNASFHELTPPARPDQPFTTIRNSQSSAIRHTNRSFRELTRGDKPSCIPTPKPRSTLEASAGMPCNFNTDAAPNVYTAAKTIDPAPNYAKLCSRNIPVVQSPPIPPNADSYQIPPNASSAHLEVIRQSIANIPVEHRGYRNDLHQVQHSIKRLEIARDLPPTQVTVHHIPNHLEYTHQYEPDRITEEHISTAKQVGFRSDLYNTEYSQKVEEVKRDLPPSQVKVQHIPKYLEYIHCYDHATDVTDEDKARAKQIGYREEMHNKSCTFTKEEIARDLPPNNVRVHHFPQYVQYSHQYDNVPGITEQDRATATQVGFRTDLHSKAYSTIFDEVAKDLPPTQVKIHHTPQHVEIAHHYESAEKITENDRATAKQLGFRSDLYNKPYSTKIDAMAKDLPPAKINVHHRPQHVEVSHQYDPNRITKQDRATAKQVGFRSDLYTKSYSTTAERVARDLPPSKINVHHMPQDLEYHHFYRDDLPALKNASSSVKHNGFRADLHNRGYISSSEEVARDLPSSIVNVNHLPRHLEFSHSYPADEGAGSIQHYPADEGAGSIQHTLGSRV